MPYPSNAVKCVCDAVQAGGYFSLCVCLTTWWLAIAELVFDVTGKVSLLHLSWQCSHLHYLHVHHAACSSTSLFLLLLLLLLPPPPLLLLLLLPCDYSGFMPRVLLATTMLHLHLPGTSVVWLTHLCVVDAALCPCLLVPLGS